MFSLEVKLRGIHRAGACLCGALYVVLWSLAAAGTPAAMAQGTLVIIGGGLNSSGPLVRERILTAAGGPANCRAAIFRTASVNLDGAEYFAAQLRKHQVPDSQITIVDIHPQNAHESAYAPATAELVRGCNLVYFTGGVQERITQSLLQKDGTDTPVLTAIRDMLKRGGVLAGTSAGAAMQSVNMISAGGLPDASIDEGMDALDFGVSDNPLRRGLTLKTGLGFFNDGIIDQHFGQYRGRLGRLSRALVAQKERYGFGIDENTALIVPPSGIIEVCGEGYLTVIDSKDAKCQDGPLGCQLQHLRVSCFSAGDRFNSFTGEATFPAGKEPLKQHADAYRGNILIADIAGRGALSHALIRGLADNTSRRQVGIALRYASHFGHGYRYTFRKTERSQGWGGKVNGDYQFAVQDVDLAIEPILSNLQSPSLALPVDLPVGSANAACQTTWFRGILLADEDRKFRPTASITRGELAHALATTVHLVTPLHHFPLIADVAEDAFEHDAIVRVLEAKLLKLDANQKFHPQSPITRQEAASVFLRLHALNGGDKSVLASLKPLLDIGDLKAEEQQPLIAAVQAGLMAAPEGTFNPRDPLTRQATAEALCRVLNSRW
jgi:cyanophycinase